MLQIEIPGYRTLLIEHVLCDLNGTLALDGRPEEGIVERLAALTELVNVGILTADTYGTAKDLARTLPVEVIRIAELTDESDIGEAMVKRRIVEQKGASRTAFLGNGANDIPALEAAALAIVVLGAEGAAREALDRADLVVPSGCAALDLLLKPKRTIAGLRR